MPDRRSRSGRGPGYVFSSLAAALFLLVAVTALTPSNPSPPSIAEFAPQPREQITETFEEQSSQFGSGEGGEVIDEIVAAPSPTPSPPTSASPPPEDEVVEVPENARVRRCVGDPPRQIEDPQSPPCVAFWDGQDNGGATWQGVTADTITIAVPYIAAGPGTGAEELSREIEALETFFNQRFEFYGRKLDLVKFAGKGEDVTNPDPERQNADAVVADEELQAFASTGYADQADATHYYYDELTRRGIVSMYSGWGTARSQEELAAAYPFQWGILPSAREISDSLGEWACINLQGPTQWSGLYNGQPRKLGLLLSPSPDGSVPDVSPLRQRLEACGLPVAVEVEVPYDDSVGAARTAVLQLATENVTTVIPFTHVSTLYLAVYKAADQNGYQPEWVLHSHHNLDADTAPLFNPGSPQLEHAFGVRSYNKILAPPDRPENWAAKEADPGAGEIDLANAKYVYWPLLVLASGIQWAGPNLTPETFGSALTQIEFPNPGAGGPPYYQASVGFGSGDHIFFDGGTPVWWDPDEASREISQRSGAFCYVDGGVRYRRGEWPTTPFELFTFDAPCY